MLMQQMPARGLAAMGIFFVFWVLMMVPFIAGWIFFLVAFWRGMKAHERIATSLTTLAQNLPSRERS